MENQIRLKWTSHQGTVLSVFDALLSTESLVDVTLACEGQYIRAHKMILSACSPYFQELINVDVNKHPIFFLKDVKYTELKALIHYMYRGEVNIPQADLQSLLAVAQALKIRGLAEVETENNSISNDTIILPDIGTKRVSKPPPAVVPVPPSPPRVVIPAVSTDAERTSIQTQGPSFVSPQSVPTITVPTLGPPAAKKSSVETRRSSSSQVQTNSSQIVDPIDVQPFPAIASTEFFHQLQNTSLPSTSSTHYGSPSYPQDTNYCHTGMVEDTELYEPAVKLEATGAIGIDLEEEENSTSRSNFSESCQLGDAENSGMRDDDGEMAGGSEGGGAEGGKVGRHERRVRGQGKFQCSNFDCSRVYKNYISLTRHLRYECNRSPQFCCTKCDHKAYQKHNLQKHMKSKHNPYLHNLKKLKFN